MIHCERSEDGRTAVSGGGTDVVLLDLDHLGDPEATAFDHLREVAPEIPVIVLAAAGDDPAVLRAMECGAQDYLVKGKTDAELFSRAVRYAQERKRMELALRRSAAMYRRLVENLNEGVLSVDAAGLITFANPRMGEILGCPAARLVGSPIAGFIEAQVNPFCRQTDERQEFELDLLRSDGDRVHALVVTSPIIDASGVFGGCLAGVLDITRRKRVDEARRQSEQKYRLGVESLSEGIWVLDPDACTSFVNPRMAEMLGYSPEEMVGRSIYAFVSPACRDRISDHLNRQKAGIR